MRKNEEMDNIYGPPKRRQYHGSYGVDDVAPWVGDIEESREPEREDVMAEVLKAARHVDDITGVPPLDDGGKPRKEGGGGVVPGSSYDFGEYGKFRLGDDDRVSPEEWRDSLGEDTKVMFDDAFQQATGYSYNTRLALAARGYGQSISLGQVTDITKRMTNPGYRGESETDQKARQAHNKIPAEFWEGIIEYNTANDFIGAKPSLPLYNSEQNIWEYNSTPGESTFPNAWPYYRERLAARITAPWLTEDGNTMGWGNEINELVNNYRCLSSEDRMAIERAIDASGNNIQDIVGLPGKIRKLRKIWKAMK